MLEIKLFQLFECHIMQLKDTKQVHFNHFIDTNILLGNLNLILLKLMDTKYCTLIIHPLGELLDFILHKVTTKLFDTKVNFK